VFDRGSPGMKHDKRRADYCYAHQDERYACIMVELVGGWGRVGGGEGWRGKGGGAQTSVTTIHIVISFPLFSP